MPDGGNVTFVRGKCHLRHTTYYKKIKKIRKLKKDKKSSDIFFVLKTLLKTFFPGRNTFLQKNQINADNSLKHSKTTVVQPVSLCITCHQCEKYPLSIKA